MQWGVYIRACSSLFRQHRAHHPLTLTIPVGFPTTDSHAGFNEWVKMNLESQSLNLLLMWCWCRRMQRKAPSKSDFPAPTEATKSAVFFCSREVEDCSKGGFPNDSRRWKLGPKYNVPLHNQPVSTDRTWPTTPALPYDTEAHPRRTPTGAQSKQSRFEGLACSAGTRFSTAACPSSLVLARHQPVDRR